MCPRLLARVSCSTSWSATRSKDRRVPLTMPMEEEPLIAGLALGISWATAVIQYGLSALCLHLVTINRSRTIFCCCTATSTLQKVPLSLVMLTKDTRLFAGDKVSNFEPKGYDPIPSHTLDFLCHRPNKTMNLLKRSSRVADTARQRWWRTSRATRFTMSETRQHWRLSMLCGILIVVLTPHLRIEGGELASSSLWTISSGSFRFS